MFNASKTQRLFMLNLANFCMIAIWLTGFDKVHWFSYVIPGALYFASISGFCLGLLIAGRILSVFGVKD